MSLSSGPTRRRALVALAAFAGLGACGFTPVYGPGSAALALRGRVTITAPRTVEGYRLLSRLEERLGRPDGATLALDVTLDIARDRVAVAEDGSITRFTLPGEATFALRDAGGVVLVSGTVDAFTSYSTTGTTVATRAAETDARARLAMILADLIMTRLLAIPA